MYQSDLNIKHGSKSHLFWGIDKATGEIVHIDDMKIRGLRCNCRCAQCNADFMAKLGTDRQRHFAHKSNYDCLYANEIAIYLRAKRWLEQNNTIRIPAVGFRFGNRRDIARREQDTQIEGVFYHCEPKQYPPLLVVETESRPVRIILGFGNYYSNEDKTLLKNEAVSKNWDCLLISMPGILEHNSLSRDQFTERLRFATNHKEWIYCVDGDSARKKLETMAVAPQSAFADKRAAYLECPIHKRYLSGRYCASISDCDECRYNLATEPRCMCLAHTGVACYRDLDMDIAKRMADVENIRNANDRQHQSRMQASYTPIRKTTLRPEELSNDKHPSKNLTTNLRGDGTVNSEGFNPDIPIEKDRFGRSWVQCIVCHRVVTTGECKTVANNGSSWGCCYQCARTSR